MLDVKKLKYDLALTSALADVMLELGKNGKSGTTSGLLPQKFLQHYRSLSQPESSQKIQKIFETLNRSE